MAQTVGFIGLGIMGRPMAKNLLKAGYPLVVHSRSQGPVEELVSAGAKAAGSAKDVAGQVDVLITMLPNSPDVELVALGRDGLIEGVKPGCSTSTCRRSLRSSLRRWARRSAPRASACWTRPSPGGKGRHRRRAVHHGRGREG